MAKTKLQKRGSNQLTDRQKRFVEEYCTDYNGSRAAAAAGFKNPKQQARKLLNGIDFPNVTKAVGALRQKQIDQIEIRKEEVLHHILMLFRSNPADLVDENGTMIDNLHDLPLGLQKSINGIKIKRHYSREGDLVGEDYELKFIPRNIIIDMVNKILGMYKTDDTPIQVEAKISFQDMLEQARERASIDPVEERIANVVQGKVLPKPSKKGK